MRKIFIHLHIPKCGGSSVSEFLSRNFGSALSTTTGILNNYQYSSEQVAKIIDHFPGLKCLTGHKLSLDLPFYREDLDIIPFTWIRDPVDRFISSYFYHRHHTALIPEAKSMLLDEYIGWALENGNQNVYIDGQVRFLSGGDFNVIQEKVNEGRLLLFPLSKLRESLFSLTRQFPDYFKDWDLHTCNVSNKDQVVTPEIRERIAPFVKNDLRLLELAMQTRIEELPENIGVYSKGSRPRRTLRVRVARLLRKAARKLDKKGGDY